MFLHKTLKRIKLKDCVGITLVLATPFLALVLVLTPLSGNAAVQLPFLTQGQTGKTLVFGGYPSCGSTCPTSLATLQQTYLRYKEVVNKNDLSVVFANIELDTPDNISKTYATSFHKDFRGYSITSAQSSHVYKSISMQTFKSAHSKPAHSGFIYLFQSDGDEWRLKRVFNSDVEANTLLKHLSITTV